MKFPRCVYHQNIRSFGFRTKLHICIAASRIPTSPNRIETIPIRCTATGRNAPNSNSARLDPNVTTPATQSIGRALPPRASSFNFSTRYPENAA